jgi:hypothetical protein
MEKIAGGGRKDIKKKYFCNFHGGLMTLIGRFTYFWSATSCKLQASTFAGCSITTTRPATQPSVNQVILSFLWYDHRHLLSCLVGWSSCIISHLHNQRVPHPEVVNSFQETKLFLIDLSTPQIPESQIPFSSVKKQDKSGCWSFHTPYQHYSTFSARLSWESAWISTSSAKMEELMYPRLGQHLDINPLS